MRARCRAVLTTRWKPCNKAGTMRCWLHNRRRAASSRHAVQTQTCHTTFEPCNKVVLNKLNTAAHLAHLAGGHLARLAQHAQQAQERLLAGGIHAQQQRLHSRMLTAQRVGRAGRAAAGRAQARRPTPRLASHTGQPAQCLFACAHTTQPRRAEVHSHCTGLLHTQGRHTGHATRSTTTRLLHKLVVEEGHRQVAQDAPHLLLVAARRVLLHCGCGWNHRQQRVSAWQ